MKTAAEHLSASKQGISNESSWLEVIRRHVGTLNFGVVQIVVHEGRVVQVERTEKLRLENPIVASNRRA